MSARINIRRKAGGQLVKFDAAKRALAEAVRVDEVKDIRDKAVAVQAYAKQAKDPRLIEHATEIRLRAERRLGELMRDMPKARNRPGPGRGKKGGKAGSAKVPALSDQNIDKHLADRARKAAAVAEDQFEAGIAKSKARAIAAAAGDKSLIKEARAERQREKKERRAQREQELAAKILALPTKTYGVVVADDGWRDEVWSEETGTDRNPTYTVNKSNEAQQIVATTAEVFDAVCADDCALFMWSTIQHLAIAIDVMRLRGFEYRSHIVWRKPKLGLGRWVRSPHEILLIGTRGNVVCPAPGTQIESVIDAEPAVPGLHSSKPDRFLEMIETYYPTTPKVELHRRGPPRPGWDAWGNEVVDAPASTTAVKVVGNDISTEQSAEEMRAKFIELEAIRASADLDVRNFADGALKR